jgi:co-chaperonin GroES (HSP10)
MTTHKPQNAYIIFEKEEYDDKTEIGTVLTQNQVAKIRGQIGLVTASPEELQHKVKAGDRIYYDRHNAFDIKVDGKIVWVCRYSDVILVI